MKSQKIYNWYMVVLCIAWSLILIFTQISGTAFDVKNEQLFFAVKNSSTVIFWISLMPIIPILWLFAFVHSIKNKKYKYIIFNVISIVVSALIWFDFFVNHIVSLCGGV